MSGPKYYTFPTSSAEEAAGILSRFSGFQFGVHATVSGNQINVTVSNEAWCAGKDYDYISEQIANAKERFRADEEMRRLLEKKKADELRRIRDLKEEISKQADQKKKKFLDAQAHCSALMREVKVSISTPFGTYDMSKFGVKCEALIGEIRSGIESITPEKDRCLSNCDQYSSRVSKCSSLKEVSKIQSNAPELSITQTFIDKKVEALEVEIKEHKKQLIAFTQFLVKLDRIISSNGLLDYKPRILKEIETLDIYSPDAIQKLLQLVDQIEREHEYMQEQMRIKREEESILREVEKQLSALRELKVLLKPLVEKAEIQQGTQIDYERLGKNSLEECDKIIDELNGLKFCSAINKNEIDSAKRSLDSCRSLLRSPAIYAQLNSLLSKLRDLRKKCQKEEESYERFAAEYERYQELYIKFRGILSAEDSDIVDEEGYLKTPADIVFEYSDAEAQIASLVEKNEQLETIINQSIQQTFTAGLSAVLYGNKLGKEFKREEYKDGSVHLSYVRDGDKGVIYDVSCEKDGQIGIIPRGVILSNGRTTINPNGLRKIHSSCAWADEIGLAFEKLGIPNGHYEEMAEEYREELYDEKNYYKITTEKESIRFLRLSGYSDDEIVALGYFIEENTDDGGTQATELKSTKSCK